MKCLVLTAAMFAGEELDTFRESPEDRVPYEATLEGIMENREPVRPSVRLPVIKRQTMPSELRQAIQRIADRRK